MDSGSDSGDEDAGLHRLQELMGQSGAGDDEEGHRAEFLRALGALGGPHLVEVMSRLGQSSMASGGGDSEINSLVQNLVRKEDPYVVLESLNVLSERLLMMNGITAERVIPASQLAQALVEIFEDPNLQDDLELQLIACRCLYNFLEVNQDFIHDALANHAVRALCAKLATVEYIDLTEQALQTLEMMSRDNLSHFSILSFGGLQCLSYLDFLTIHAQRKCIAIVANACTNVSTTQFDKIKEAIDNIATCVTHPDPQVVSSAWQAISRIVVSYRNHPRMLQELMAPLLPQMIEVMATNALVLKSVIICANSVELSRELLQNNVGQGISATASFLDLIAKLLPVQRHSVLASKPLKVDPDREDLCREIGPAYHRFVEQVWPHLLETFGSTDADIRKCGLVCILRILGFGGWRIPDVSGLVKLVSSVKGENLLRLGALEIARQLMETYPESVDMFDRQGFFSDLPSVSANDIAASDTLANMAVDEDENDDDGDDENINAEDDDNDDDDDDNDDDDDEDNDESMGEGESSDDEGNEEPRTSRFGFPRWSPISLRRPTSVQNHLEQDPELSLVPLPQDQLMLRLRKVTGELKRFVPERNLDKFNAIRVGLARGEWQDLSTVSSYELIGLVDLILPLEVPEEVDLAPLVTKLHESLDRVEPFEIISASHDLAKQIKIKLVSKEAQMILSVHAIATFNTVESYLMRLGFKGVEFTINDETVPKDMTIFGAIYRSLQTKEDEIIEPSRVWTLHEVKFATESTEKAVASTVVETELAPPENQDERVSTVNPEGVSGTQPSPPSSPNASPSRALGAEFSEISVGEPTLGVLRLLQKLYDLKRLPSESFVSSKLTKKMNRQLEEPLVVASTLPGWIVYLTKYFPFLFPMGTRLFFLQSTSFGYSRLIHHWQLRTQDDGDSGAQKLGRPTRQKVRISRKTMFGSAIKVLEHYGSSPGILEIEYFDEEGSGLGPTLEFYSSVSHEFSKVSTMWRANSQLLFPSPEATEKNLFLFYTLGKFVGRALLDSRLVDMNFNPGFLQMLWGSTTLSVVDPELAQSLHRLLDASAKELAEMDLQFTLPGYDSIELVKGGARTLVTTKNVHKYVELVTEKTLDVRQQVNRFKEGFSLVFPIDSMAIFTPPELCELLGQADEDWSSATLIEAIHANHGYTRDSRAITRLVQVLAELSLKERRAFLQFMTGSPKLPIGGFKALRPELTVVRKLPESGTADDYLPSVMTCANYLKLPDYSSVEVMRSKLLQAINDGAGVFLLS
ncbi:hypothetical protein DIURU_002866 [Diutina rugosa]|uniref:HECT-type E3 ubiquitin transferase n=1 Tax=Diutina rugosa TaxID=5481 RepID=A0A642UNH4_DIURU|nr:uncharacterized protein DIURU_002866 [Diutina rugosa]KAA8902412.1 hypothetical protein DIURU_002866 [Diutina rugosa]